MDLARDFDISVVLKYGEYVLQVGDIDFYPNGGIASMNGCEGEDVALGCSHDRAPVRII